MATKAQQQILAQIKAKGVYETTSDRSAKSARDLADQGVQHIYSCELPDTPGKIKHRFAQRQDCC
ncbi:MAG: hypothetical protein WBA99_17765 [Nodosilinea sp.]